MASDSYTLYYGLRRGGRGGCCKRRQNACDRVVRTLEKNMKMFTSRSDGLIMVLKRGGACIIGIFWSGDD